MIDDMISQARQASDIISDAVSRGDFDSLNDRVRQSLDYARDAARERAEQYTAENAARRQTYGTASRRASDRVRTPGAASASAQGPESAEAGQKNTERPVRKEKKPAEKPLFREPSSAGPVVMVVGGLILMAGFGLASIPMHMSGISFLAGVGIVFDILAAASAVLALAGGILSGRKKRFAVYKELLKDKKYADVRMLAEAVGRSEVRTLKELKALVAEGAFPEGHFDKSEKTFMVSDEMYDQYQKTESMSEALKKEEEAEEASYAGLSPKARAVVKQGEKYVRQIRENNDAIPDPVVSEKLDRMERVTARIFAQVRKNPKLADGLNMLMEYYLPTTDKLITAYREMDSQPIQGENIRSAKTEIEGTLDTINDAFERILDGFYEDDAVDLSTDISVMKTLMKQQGLSGQDMKAEDLTGVEEAMEKGPTLAELNRQIAEESEIKLKL